MGDDGREVERCARWEGGDKRERRRYRRILGDVWEVRVEDRVSDR